jgi:hypothetical protein
MHPARSSGARISSHGIPTVKKAPPPDGRRRGARRSLGGYLSRNRRERVQACSVSSTTKRSKANNLTARASTSSVPFDLTTLNADRRSSFAHPLERRPVVINLHLLRRCELASSTPVVLLGILKLGNHEAHAALSLLSLIDLRWLRDRRPLDLDFDVAAECPQADQ